MKSIVHMKNSTLRFWHIYTFWGLLNAFTLGDVCIYVCMSISEHDSVKTGHSIELTLRMYITGHRRTNSIDFNKCRMYIYIYILQECKKEFSYITAYSVISHNENFLFLLHNLSIFWNKIRMIVRTNKHMNAHK